MTYLLVQNKDALPGLMNHAYQHSISDCLVKIMQLEEQNFSYDMSDMLAKKKVEMVSHMCHQIASSENDQCVTVASQLLEVIEQV